MISTLGSIVNIIGGGGGRKGGPIWPLNGHERLDFDNEIDIHMSSKNHKECAYNLNLDLLTILYSSMS
jgi:hypothetical protein